MSLRETKLISEVSVSGTGLRNLVCGEQRGSSQNYAKPRIIFIWANFGTRKVIVKEKVFIGRIASAYAYGFAKDTSTRLRFCEIKEVSPAF